MSLMHLYMQTLPMQPFLKRRSGRVSIVCWGAMTAWIVRFFSSIGLRCTSALTRAWAFFMFTVEVAIALGQFLGRQGFVASFRVSMQQVYFTGLEAMPFLSLLSLS